MRNKTNYFSLQFFSNHYVVLTTEVDERNTEEINATIDRTRSAEDVINVKEGFCLPPPPSHYLKQHIIYDKRQKLIIVYRYLAY